MKRFLCISLSLFCLCVVNAQEVIEGVVKNKQDRPIANAVVKVNGRGRGHNTASDGSFRIDVSSSARSLTVDADGYYSKSDDIDGGYMFFVLRSAPSEIKSGYESYIQIGNTINMTDGTGGGYMVGLHYIGGYRFNKSIFLGLGIGLDFAVISYDDWYYRTISDKTFISSIRYGKPLLTIPLFLNFRYDIRKERWLWNPYISTSVGYQIASSRNERFLVDSEPLRGGIWSTSSDVIYEVDDANTKFWNGGFLCDVSVGINRRITKGRSIYMGLGYKLYTGKYDKYNAMTSGWYGQTYKTFVCYTDKLHICTNHALSVVLGVSF